MKRRNFLKSTAALVAVVFSSSGVVEQLSEIGERKIVRVGESFIIKNNTGLFFYPGDSFVGSTLGHPNTRFICIGPVPNKENYYYLHIIGNDPSQKFDVTEIEGDKNKNGDLFFLGNFKMNT